MSSDIERDEESDGYGLSEEEVKQEQFMLLDAFIEELEEELEHAQCIIPKQGFDAGGEYPGAL